MAVLAVCDASCAGAGARGCLSAPRDQQLAGMIMWVPAGLAYLAAALAWPGAGLRVGAIRGVRQFRSNGMPRGVVLLASLLLLGVAGIAGVVGLLGRAERAPPELMVAGGDPERGKEVIRQSGCSACHVIPGIAGANGLVGPPLDRFARRAYVGGVLPNRPQNLVAWILDPPAVDPLTAMPAPGISESEARDVAAYLYTLR